MPQKVFVISLNDSVSDIVKHATEILNKSQSEFHFHLVPNTVEFSQRHASVYSWNYLSSILISQKEKLNAKYIFGVLAEPIQYNWFSRTVHDQNVCFITTKDWEYLSQLPLPAFVGYEIVENLAEMFVGDINAHDETRGCIFDMVAIKPHISFKMRTADICPDCLDLLNSKVEPSFIHALISMLEAIRLVALGRNKKSANEIKPASTIEIVDRDFPFPLAYCFRSMQSELSYSRKWLKLLELYEVIIKYVAIVLLCAWREKAAEIDFPQRFAFKELSKPSIGHWHSLGFNLLKSLRSSSIRCFVSKYTDALTEKIINQSREASQRLVQLRNDTKGHGFVEEEARYQALYEENLPKIQKLIEFVSGLSHFKLIKAGQQERLHGVVNFSAKVLMSSHPLFPVQQFKTTNTVDSVCNLFDPNTGEFLSLYPWLILENCKSCFREVVFLYDKLDDDCVAMREYPTNHKQEKEELFTDISNLIFGN